MYKPIFTVLSILMLAPTAFAQSPCNPHPLFNSLPQHNISGCEEREYEVLKMTYYDKNSNWIEQEKAGYQLKTFYTFSGDWEKRPSNTLIFQNYTQAILAKGGTVLSQSNSILNLQIKSGADSWWVTIQSDQSGTFSVTCLREQNMNQYIVLSVEDISREINSYGKAAFYGIFFDTDKSDIKPESTETLEQMAKYLKANPKVEVYIVGHTDNTGTFEHNLKLSVSRAEAVVNALATSFGIPAQRLKAQGVASLSPVMSNGTEDGKTKNRRVEMVIK